VTTRVHAWTADGDSKPVPAGRTAAVESAPASAEVLMERFLDGDVHAFELLFKRLAPRVVGVLAQLSGDARLAEDLTQVVFLKLYRARAAYRRGMQLTPWLFAIARNVFLDERRRRRRRPEALSPDGQLPELVCEPRVELDGDTRARLQAVLQTLPPVQRQVLILLKLEGLSLAEVAAFLGTSIASVKMRVHRAYRTLRERLSQPSDAALDLEREGVEP
jgi:RNA polymerase sigma-70 factor (ECF subfamily)